MKYAARRRAMKREAAAILFRRPGACLFAGGAMLVFCAGSGILLREALILFRAFWHEDAADAFSLVLLAGAFAAVSPFFAGAAAFFSDCAAGMDPPPTVLLRYYSSAPLFFSALRGTTLFAVLFLLFSALPQCVFSASAALEAAAGFIGLAEKQAQLLKSVLAAASFGLILLFAVQLCGFAFSFRLLRGGKTPLFACIRQSFRIMRRKKLEFFLLNVSFIPLFLCSYFTFGILFICSLPYYFLTLGSFFCYAASQEKPPVFYSFSTLSQQSFNRERKR